MSETSDKSMVTIDREFYEELLRYKRYAYMWQPNFRRCKKCGEFNVVGYCCAHCGTDNSKIDDEYDEYDV